MSLRALLIDDDPMVLRTLHELIVADGHEVIAADGGRAGIDSFNAALARGEHIDVVITDLSMQGVNGRRVVAAIKSAAPSVPIILLTGWGDLEGIRADPSVRADCVIGKPLRLAALREALAELAGAGR